MWKKLQKFIAKTPPVFRNTYFITGTAFALWMIFGDENNLMLQFRRHRELTSLLDKKTYYLKQIDETQKQTAELTSNPATQEKFAREHYWMKRDNEDVFVIVQSDISKP
jgi:cell division protein DivIC